HRAGGGIGRIQMFDEDGKEARMKFRTPEQQVAVAAKRDPFQHPFLEHLYDWGKATRLFQFGSEMSPGKLRIAISNKQIVIEVNEKETDVLVPIFHKAMQEFKEEFKQAVIADMKAIGYNLAQIGIRRPDHTRVHGLIPGELVGVFAKEEEMKCQTDQPQM